MNLIESVKSSLANVLSNKMRSLLTMLGIIIGISSVIMITSIGNGFKNSTIDSFSKMGAENITLSIDTQKDDIRDGDYFSDSDIKFLKSLQDIKYVYPTLRNFGKTSLREKSKTKNCMIYGTSDEYNHAGNTEIKSGRFLSDRDVAAHSSVVVIDTELSRKVFGTENSLNQKMKVKLQGTTETTLNLKVIGVFKSKNSAFGVFDMPSTIFIPYTSLIDVLPSDRKNIDSLTVVASDKDKLESTQSEIVRFMELRHNTTDKYYANNLLSSVDEVNDVLDKITLFIAFVAAISLLVGGIGVMNIMLVTVTERTREIGIRKSLGATNANIKFQFLVESVILTVIGGIIGVLLGWGGAILVSKIIKEITPAFSISSVLVTVLISSSIGIIFGVYPAGKAAKLDPIEALRYE